MALNFLFPFKYHSIDVLNCCYLERKNCIQDDSYEIRHFHQTCLLLTTLIHMYTVVKENQILPNLFIYIYIIIINEVLMIDIDGANLNFFNDFYNWLRTHTFVF